MSNFILQIVINILVLIGGYFVGRKLDRLKVAQEIKERHLKEIHEQVFQPLLEVFKNHLIPILERKKVNLTLKARVKFKKNTVTPSPVYIEDSLATYEEPPSLKPINPHLYRDAIDNHYTEILKKYELFKLNADKYIDDCLSYAKEIKDQILLKINLPKYNPFQSGCMEEWINSSRLAVFIVRKQMIPNDENLSLKFEEISGQPHLTKIRDGSYDECAICKNSEKLKEILDEILKKREKAKELISLADKLKNDCLNIIDELEKLCLSEKLIGDCSYVKF